jgi:hypothetical protein
MSVVRQTRWALCSCKEISGTRYKAEWLGIEISLNETYCCLRREWSPGHQVIHFNTWDFVIPTLLNLNKILQAPSVQWRIILRANHRFLYWATRIQSIPAVHLKLQSRLKLQNPYTVLRADEPFLLFINMPMWNQFSLHRDCHITRPTSYDYTKCLETKNPQV